MLKSGRSEFQYQSQRRFGPSHSVRCWRGNMASHRRGMNLMWRRWGRRDKFGVTRGIRVTEDSDSELLWGEPCFASVTFTLDLFMLTGWKGDVRGVWEREICLWGLSKPHLPFLDRWCRLDCNAVIWHTHTCARLCCLPANKRQICSDFCFLVFLDPLCFLKTCFPFASLSPSVGFEQKVNVISHAVGPVQDGFVISVIILSYCNYKTLQLPAVQTTFLSLSLSFPLSPPVYSLVWTLWI